tara:strand:- start:481 stop:720 length:240 start_codon:yes stop_codon:yes gene_type:complete
MPWNNGSRKTSPMYKMKGPSLYKKTKNPKIKNILKNIGKFTSLVMLKTDVTKYFNKPKKKSKAVNDPYILKKKADGTYE